MQFQIRKRFVKEW